MEVLEAKLKESAKRQYGAYLKVLATVKILKAYGKVLGSNSAFTIYLMQKKKMDPICKTITLNFIQIL